MASSSWASSTSGRRARWNGSNDASGGAGAPVSGDATPERADADVHRATGRGLRELPVILREADTRPTAEVAKKHGISDQTIYAWRKRCGALEPADVRRLRQLEQENGRLKKMVADRDLELDVLKEITRKKW